MGLKRIVLKIIFHDIVDVEATQRIKNPVPEETACGASLSGQGRMWSPCIPLPKGILDSPHYRTKPSLWGKKCCSFTGFMMLIQYVLMEKLSSTLLASKESAGLASVFVTKSCKYLSRISLASISADIEVQSVPSKVFSYFP